MRVSGGFHMRTTDCFNENTHLGPQSFINIYMSGAQKIVELLIEEGIAARAHFQIWWALRNLAIPRYLDTMNDHKHVDFFYAVSTGSYKLFLLALAKIFDRDSRVAGISEFKRALRAEGYGRVALQIAKDLKPIEPHVKAVMGIRNRSLVHNEQAITRTKVYSVNGITPNQLQGVIDTVCESINFAARELGVANTIGDSDRCHQATLNMLARLERGGD